MKTKDGDHVGRITEVMEGPVVDCWIIKGPLGEHILPAVKDVVVSVDLDEGVVIAGALQEFEA